MKQRAIYVSMLVLILAISAGCSTTSVNFRTESNFAYPNSNVIPLGTVRGESTSMACALGMPASVTSTMKDEAVKNALQQKQGDLLVNYLEFSKITNLVVIPLTCASYAVEGVAAKMQIGTQKLK